MVSVCMYLHVHQPMRLGKYRVFDVGRHSDYFDKEKNKEILERVIQKSYAPTNQHLLDLIHRTDGKFKVSFSITGILLKQLEEYPHIIESFKKLVDTGCCNIVGETYFHSLAYVFSREEFKEQVRMQEKTLKEVFGVRPKIFRNTELVYQNDVGKIAEEMGYKAVLAEGWDKVLEWRSPCFVYQGKGSGIKLLLKNYRLSDDIAFRFSNRGWKGWPLTADKFANWVGHHNGNGNLINLFMDYETFGEHQWKETGIFDFLSHLPHEILKRGDDFVLPTEAIKRYPVVSEIDFPHMVSWADTERDLSAWIGNGMQDAALKEIYAIEQEIKRHGTPEMLEKWRMLQVSDHFYYMCTKWFSDGDVHKYFNPYDNPYEAFVVFMNALADLRHQLNYIKKEKTNFMSKHLLNEVPAGKEFYCKDGKVFRKVEELAKAIRKLDTTTYKAHVDTTKNDFANWLEHVVGDAVLANKIRRAQNQTTMARIVNSRVAELSLM
ncbi:MAG: glycoside hydrolase family 57 protein [Candidatus Aenigmarchaeota archaeon]|nr:glycoside hydrolase family 57 protein [Candidatus Aenigmarchaeota archaeon]